MSDEKELSTLVGQTITRIERDEEGHGINFLVKNGTEYSMRHLWECCESVWLEDIEGDLNDLVGSPILSADEESGSSWCDDLGEAHGWTFYKIQTAKGGVTLRWNGKSNGYYSMEVHLIREQMPPEKREDWKEEIVEATDAKCLYIKCSDTFYRPIYINNRNQICFLKDGGDLNKQWDIMYRDVEDWRWFPLYCKLGGKFYKVEEYEDEDTRMG